MRNRPLKAPVVIRLPYTLMIACRKGGVGKSMLTLHIAWACAQAGLRVLVLCADTSGDSYRRLAGKKAHADGASPVEWFPGCWVSYTRAAYVYPDPAEMRAFDVIIVDTAGNLDELPDGPPTAEVLVPVSSIDGARGALQTIEDARRRLSSTRVTVILNTIDADSPEDRIVRSLLGEELPAGVVIEKRSLPHNDQVKNTEWTCKPAWAGRKVDPCPPLTAFCKQYVARTRRWCDYLDFIETRDAILTAGVSSGR